MIDMTKPLRKRSATLKNILAATRRATHTLPVAKVTVRANLMFREV